MKKETFKATVESAFGRKLKEFDGYKGPDVLEFDVSYDAYENYPELDKAGKVPSQSEIVDMVNAKEKASARAKQTTEVLKANGIEKPDPNSETERRKRMIQDFVNSGADLEFATKTVDTMLQTVKAKAAQA